ncbi:hypothetical protein Tco_1395909 [Tanacetum coccineum]
MTRSAGRPAATPRRGRTGGRTGRGGGKTRGRSSDQGNGRIDSQGGQNSLPTIVAQVGSQGSDQGNSRNQNGDAVNDNIWGDVRNVIENNDCRGCTYKEFLACNPKAYGGKGGTAKRWLGRTLSDILKTWDELREVLIRRFCPPSLTFKQIEEIHNYRQKESEILYET